MAKAATVRTAKGTVIAVARACPDTRPPPARMRTQAAVVITPPASSTQPASRASAPWRVNRRNKIAVASSGPASGTVTDTAFAA